MRDTLDAIFTTTDWKGAARQIDLDLRVNVLEEARAMKQETLVIGCVHDYIVPISHSKALMETIPNARYAELETGHGGCVENFEQFIKVADNFLM